MLVSDTRFIMGWVVEHNLISLVKMQRGKDEDEYYNFESCGEKKKNTRCFYICP
jgi:hypothetical protein